MNAHSSARQQWVRTADGHSELSAANIDPPTGQCIVDHTGQIVFANDIAQHLLRLRKGTSDEGAFHTHGETIGPFISTQPLVHRVLRTGQPAVDAKLTLEWADGVRRVLCTHAQPLNEGTQAETVGAALTFLDVTACCARSARARELRADRERAAYIKSLAAFAGAIAHEFNNLLMSIVGESELAIQAMDPSHTGHGHLQHILHTARRAAELTQQLLIYSGKGRFLARPVRLHTALQGLVDELQPQNDKDVELRWELPEDLPAVEVDREQLRQCMALLVQQATQSISRKRGGTVRVDAHHHYVDADSLRDTIERSVNATPGHYVVIEVSGDGKGLQPSMRSRLFAPMFSRRLLGGGLGLAVVAGFARSHGGFVDMVSGRDHKTVMCLGLPAQAAPDVEGVGRRPSNRPVPSSLPLGVLIVDDEATVRSVIAMLLNRASATTFVTGDGESALSCFAAECNRIDVALVDMSMPGMNGIEVMSSLRALQPELPVVLMSGFAADQACEQDDITRFLAKPFTREQLFSAIQAIARDATAVATAD